MGEYGHRSPVYAAIGDRNGSHNETIELVLRDESDVYVRSSHLTQGCSNCEGHPYGSAAATGAELFACHAASLTRPAALAARRRCFGDPPRLAEAIYLACGGSACF